MKALGPDASRRYRSARDFQADLQAFLENRPVRAEMERRHGWNAGATIQRIRKVTHTVVQFHRHLQVVGGVSWFLLGMALWIGATLTYAMGAREPRLTLQFAGDHCAAGTAEGDSPKRRECSRTRRLRRH